MPEYADIVFPLKLGPLTYRVPPGIGPGMLVEAEVGRAVQRGLVLGPRETPPEGRIKEIAGVIGEGPAVSAAFLRLVSWMAEYYMAPEGIVLKGILPREFFRPVARRQNAEAPAPPGIREPEATFSVADAPGEAANLVRESLARGTYATFLYHAAGYEDEEALVMVALDAAPSGSIVLAPDRDRAGRLFDLIARRWPERAVLLRSGMSGGRRTEALDRIRDGRAGIVVGSRTALFAPLPRVSLIAVMGEESKVYKEESGVRYGARDAAVMRALLEGATALLTSLSPSLESLQNAGEGKYTLLPGSPRAGKPKVRIVDARRIARPEVVSPRMRAAIASAIGRGERVMVVVNRPGYSILRCPECGYLPRCPSCEIALVFYKGARTLRCSYCGGEAALFDLCPSCGGREVGPAGAGIERIGEELAGIDPSFGVIEETEARLVIGSKRLARGRRSEGFALVAVLGADAFLFVPDFRARERAFQDLCHAAALLKPGGELLLVTRNPTDPLFRDIRGFAFDLFAERELAERRELGYPPFRKLALLTLAGTAKLPRRALPPGVELLGPAPFIDRRGRKGQKYLLKADAPRPLRKALAILREAAPALDFDIDPVST